VLHGAKPVPDVKLAGGLNSGKDTIHLGKVATTQATGKMNSSLDLTAIARRAAERAAAYLRGVERPVDPTLWTEKGHNDFVTDVDRTSEAIIAEVLRRATPGSTMVGEESAPEIQTRGLVWIVDPIDGTTNFVHGFPVYSVSIAAAVDGVLEAAVVLHVGPDICYHATRGHGAWLGNTRLAVSRITNPKHALIGTGFPFKHLGGLATYQRQLERVIPQTSGVRRAGSAALDLAWVAAGAFDGFWELMLAPWDIAAGLLLVREAGGVATDLRGREVGAEHTGIVAGNPAIAQWLLAQMGPPSVLATPGV
jgi:myo-inositol-1(or 4)-monophosphatase